MTSDPETVLEVQSRCLGAIRALRLVGELDAYTAPAAQRKLDEVISGGGALRLIVDRTPLTFMATMGITLMMNLRAQVAGREGRLVLVLAFHGFPRRLFEVTGLVHRFEVRETIEEAVAVLRREGPDDGTR
ncbi:anti-sigma factor antagonist [Planomonospora corallina]|uniref:Anti-sigma factor antagonist n=1 Tax=Planomonospora corallina TaxID=1806052 RepID=A0ABV8I4A1_9ACTN